jgi:tetratricopeptide (TPR) repeat protein
MSRTQARRAQTRNRNTGTPESRRLAELARAAGLGDSHDAALDGHRESLLDINGPSPLAADVLRWEGTVLRDSGRLSDAEPLYRRSIEMSTSLDYDAGRAHGMNCLAGVAQRRGDVVAATNFLTDALLIAERCGETRLVGMIQQNLGIIADVRGDPASALAHYRISLRTFEGTNDLQPLCWVLINLGLLHAKEERYSDARAAFDRGLTIARARGDLLSEGALAENRAELLLTIGQIDEADIAIRRALKIAEQRHDQLRRAAALKLRGAHARLAGRPAESVEILRHALAFSTEAEDALVNAEILYQYGLALHASGDAEAAETAWKGALEAFERVGARQWVARVGQQLSLANSSRYL